MVPYFDGFVNESVGALSDGCNGHHIVPVGHVIPWSICSLHPRAVDVVYEALFALVEVDALCACVCVCVCVCVYVCVCV